MNLDNARSTFSQYRSLTAATLGHFSVDMYSGMLPMILVVLTDTLHLTYFQIGFISTVYSLAGSLSQPFFGWLGDQRGNRPMAVLGVAGIAVTVGVMRFVDDYYVLLALSIIAGLGSGAFHPQGATLAADVPAKQRGVAASIFMFGGNGGYSTGPIFGTALFGLTGALMPQTFAVLGFAQAALIFWLLAERQRQFHAAPTKQPIAAAKVMAPIAVIIILTLVIFFRSWMSAAVSTYVPQVFKSFGYSNDDSGRVLFSVLFPVAVGGLMGGTLSDRFGRRRVLIASTILSGPALVGLMLANGAMVYASGALLGVAIGASFPVTLVMAQSLVPRGLGLMSGIVLGFTFVAGAVGTAASGYAADTIGLLPTMYLNAALPVIAGLLAFWLPKDESPQKQRA
ncbi:MAG: MFS transporter [Chloroflexi bacterium]|nr:MFS transporter [Chloroflexota bacterium]